MVGYSGTSAQPQKSACTLRLRRDSPLSMPNRTPAVKQCSGWSPATLTFQVVYLHDESSTVWVGHSHTLNLYCTAEMNCAIIRTFNERLMQCIFFSRYMRPCHKVIPTAIVAVIFHTLPTHISSEKSIRALKAFRWAGFTELLFCCGSLTSLTLSLSWLMLPQSVMITHL